MTPYHAGERAAHRRAGLVEAAAVSAGAIGNVIPPAAVAFLAEQPLLVIGAADDAGRQWASLLTGAPGFVRATGPTTVEITGGVLPVDPLAAALSRPAQVGIIAIEPATRRRMRINGRATPTAVGLTVTTDQVYANCPKYIQKRASHPDPERGPVGTPVAGSVLSDGQRRLLGAADTFFVSTRSAAGDVDVSHRGGNPGFVEVHDATALRWPDYVGNAMMMTLGNLEQERAAGLLFVDWDSGTTVQLTGSAAVDWVPDHAAAVPGAQRLVDFVLDRVVQVGGASPLRWTPPVASRFNPALNPALPAPIGGRS